MPTLALIPASTSAESARSRCRGGAVPGSVVRHTSGSSVGTENVTRDLGPPRRLLQDVDVAHDQRPARDQAERRPRPSEHLDARAREPVAALGRLVRVGRGADRDLLAAPRRARELALEHLGDVHLDADRAAVAVVGRPVGPQLERADVTERAAVDAAGVRVQRPGERHPLDAVQGAPALLLAVLGPHRPSIEHMFVSTPIVIGYPDGAAARHPPDHERRCRPARGTSTPTCCRARTAGRSSTRASACPTRRRSGPTSLDGAEVARIFITHFHPDHVGAAADVAELTGSAGQPGRARLRAVRARLGQPRTGRSGSPTGSSRTASRARSPRS